MTSQTPNRLDWVDAARGGAILLVVLGHSWRGLNAKGLIAPEVFSAIDSRIYAFHMPVFFLLSGLFFAGSLARTDVWGFVQSRVLRLFWPMVLWTYIFLAVKLLAGDRANSPVALPDLLTLPVPGILHLWFLWALFLLHIAFAATRPVLRNRHYPGAFLALVAAGAVLVSLVPLPQQIMHWVGPALRHAPYFVLGLVIARWSLMPVLSGRARLGAGVVFLVLLALWPNLSLHPVAGLAATGGLALCFVALFVAQGDQSSVGMRGLVALGVASMTIFLTHTIFSAGARELLLAIGINNLHMHLILGVLIGALGPIPVLIAARKSGTQRFFGF